MSESLRNTLIVIVFIFAALFLYTKLLGPIQISVNSVNTQKQDLFQTTGTGEVTGVPNKASVALGVIQNAKTADEARLKANQIINEVASDLKKLGIDEEDIKTTNFSVYPENPIEPTILDTQEGSSSLIAPVRPGGTGFTASANLEVKTDSVDLANKAIDTASAAGANVIGGVSFTFDDKTKKELEAKARREAVKEAKEKANELASTAGIKLGKVINITESDFGFPTPYGAVAMKEDAASQTDLQPGENKVTITITLTFETL